MFSIIELIVLLLICGTTVCQTEKSALPARFQRQSQSHNANDRRYSNPNTETNESIVAKTIRDTFITVNGPGLVLFNNTHNTNQKVVNTKSFRQDHSLDEKQEFKVQRNPDGKLNIVFNDAFLSQKSVPQGNTASVEKQDPIFSQQRDEIGIDPRCMQGGKSFCTEVQNYPALEVENILKSQISKFDVLFGDDDIPQPTNISQRMSPGEDSLCKSIEKIIYPKAAESKDLKWLYIVNQQNYTQAVKIEECSEPETACMFAENFPNGYVTKCKQNYTFRQLVAITLDNKVKTDIFKLPSCCKCIIKQL